MLYSFKWVEIIPLANKDAVSFDGFSELKYMFALYLLPHDKSTNNNTITDVP
ncbi:hypothetical protein [Chryseobacterium echinoideorum]|uniref:hypothetical protein n=1 Tax=Chryseobacterium echinoideorum TaxID=1549648 RepID=UPI001624EAED|nr:hypothetical protein [Chryseobacterium echinoideorum]